MLGPSPQWAMRDENEFNVFNKIKVGPKVLEDAVIQLGSVQKTTGPHHPFVDKRTIYRALLEKDLPTLREISNFWYRTNGIYERVIDYFAFMYRYDWYVSSAVFDETVPTKKILTEYSSILTWLDNSYIKKICGDIALCVLINGAYYGYVIPNKDAIYLQQLPNAYCRSRYTKAGLPCVEFNMKYFDTFRDIQYRMKILNLFPDEFKKAYIKYQKNKLEPDFQGDSGGWYLLDPDCAVKFNFNGSDIPTFVNAIPALIDLDAAQDLDRRKQMQNLLKILIQKLPLDKNGELIFDIDEARDIHNNAVEMLKRAIGVDVVTTFADVDAIDLSDRNTTTTKDDLEKVERSVFNAIGTSKNIFNTDGNLALEKSILNDESTMRNLLLQFNIFFNNLCIRRSKNKKKYAFNFYMLETTQYNYKELSKMYKEQTQMGCSKLLPQIALGHSQSFILNAAVFENEVLHLSEIMIPPLLSSTMSGQDLQSLGKNNQNTQNNNQKSVEGQKVAKQTDSSSTGGRPEKPDAEKSEKTIRNKESMS